MMNREQARTILEKRQLETGRAGGVDRDDPEVREALAQLQRDPQLARWYADLRQFDHSVAASLQSLPVPADLRRNLLAARPGSSVIYPPASWWQPAWNGWRIRAAAAAAIVLIAATVTGALSHRQPVRFADFRKELVEESWSQNHLAYRSANILRIRQWLAQNGGPTAFNLPTEFRHRQLQGCNLVDVGGQPVAVLCFAEGSRHLHLFVAEDVQFADLPTKGAPEFERCGLWKTASWQDGKRTFVLTGMSYSRFVTTFRKAGRWTMSG